MIDLLELTYIGNILNVGQTEPITAYDKNGIKTLIYTAQVDDLHILITC